MRKREAAWQCVKVDTVTLNIFTRLPVEHPLVVDMFSFTCVKVVVLKINVGKSWYKSSVRPVVLN